MNGLEAVLNMLVNVVMQVICVLGNVINSLVETEGGKQVFGENDYAGSPTSPTPPMTVEALQAAGIDTALKFLIPVMLIAIFVSRVNLSKKVKR